jgi:hypothetical protein
MTNYRVPVRFQQPPAEAEQSQDNPDFAQKLFDQLDGYAVVGADPDRADFGDVALEVVDDVQFNVNVTIVDPATVPVPAGHVPPATGEAAAEIVVARALFSLGYDRETATIDSDAITAIPATTTPEAN